ncbi:MAG: endonuclease/exonuclease/phosphatase family protein [Gammaproteobacteria bacterium]|nr:endonuclease/exonuclease/phosphatase family protein [Gammaproteobacteria bacterium]
MPNITDAPPEFVAKELQALSADLDRVIPAKKLDNNLLVATWNIRAFGDLTEQWTQVTAGSPKRNLHALSCIAEIVSRFDVIGIQEVRGNLKCLRDMLRALGPHWSFVMTDVTRGDRGNNERMAFVFDTRKVGLSGLACELVVPEDQDIGENAFARQFARTPYAVAFKTGGQTFILVTLHIYYGAGPEDRIKELKAIAQWLSDWAEEEDAWDHDLIALGDFNIDRIDDPLYRAFTSTGLFTPPELNNVPRTIFSEPGGEDDEKFYDQIAWFANDEGKPKLSMRYGAAGSFDFTKTVMTSLSEQSLSWRISDHYPLWVEFLL